MESVVEIGGYVLEPGNDGTAIHGGGDGTGATVKPLRRAFAEAAPPPETEPALVTEVDEASKATAKIERAVALCKGIGEGKALDPTQLGLEIGALLDCLERLDRKKEHKKSIQMARALATLLMLLKRWADLLQTLRSALRAGEQLNDLDAIAWAEHELGTLRLAAGDVEGAEWNLHQAKEIRERIGDRRGLAVTERNLGTLCERMRQMLRKEELVRRRGRWPATSRLALFAALFAFVFATAGFAVGSLTNGSPSPGESKSLEDPNKSRGDPSGTGPGEGPGESSYDAGPLPDLPEVSK